MRPTDFCFPSLRQRAPAPRRFPIACNRFDPISATEERDTSRYPARFGGSRAFFRCGAFLPRAEALDRTSDTPVASEIFAVSTPYCFGATTPLSKRLARFARRPRDGTTKPSNRGAFHRQVPEPSTRAPAVECRPRVMTRV